jgi:hypothetical protein
VGLERGIVFLDKLVKEGAFRAMALVETRTSARTGVLASRRRASRRVSKDKDDAPESIAILRDALLRIAPHDESGVC